MFAFKKFHVPRLHPLAAPLRISVITRCTLCTPTHAACEELSMPATDELVDWLARTALGDARAFERLYHATSPRLYAVALRLVRRRDWAEDILQEC